jgi:hypothetical protein
VLPPSSIIDACVLTSTLALVLGLALVVVDALVLALESTLCGVGSGVRQPARITRNPHTRRTT